MLLKTFKT